MKELILVRHAKSSWEFNVNDLQRPLKTRGYKDIVLVAKAFSNTGHTAEALFCSPAKRARQTAELFVKNAFSEEKSCEIVDKLYDFSGESVIDFIKTLDDHLNKVLIFGHNHAFTAISNSFGSRYIDNVPTSGLVYLKFEIDKWSNLTKGTTVLSIFPRDLK
jgi:phosphohistidine phosphatase